MASKTSIRTKTPYYPTKVVTRVGVLQASDSHDEAEMTVGELAEIHEFGLGVPARAPVGTFAATKGAELRTLGARLFAGAAKAGTRAAYKQAAGLLAVKAGAEIRNVIVEKLSPDLAESTKRSKRARGYQPPYTPLVETGDLRSHYVGDSEVT